ncbi:MAG: hypothetical protein JOY91_04885 [Sinobacteraceae bacterium]|nr:hypothetical protein [Nevskiaceae bacterium]
MTNCGKDQMMQIAGTCRINVQPRGRLGGVEPAPGVELRRAASLACGLAVLLLSGCAAHPAASTAPAGKLTPQLRSGSPELRAYQIQDWIAPDDHTMVVNSVDHALFRAQFKGRCNGLRLVDTVSFIVLDATQFDRYGGVVLPDGTRCAFAAVTRLDTGAAAGQ